MLLLGWQYSGVRRGLQTSGPPWHSGSLPARCRLGTICESGATGAVCEFPSAGEAGAPEFGHVFVARLNLHVHRDVIVTRSVTTS